MADPKRCPDCGRLVSAAKWDTHHEVCPARHGKYGSKNPNRARRSTAPAATAAVDPEPEPQPAAPAPPPSEPVADRDPWDYF